MQVDRRQRTEDRKQKTENRKQKTENRLNGRSRRLTAKAVMLARVASMEVLLAKICASAASRMLLPYWSPPVSTQHKMPLKDEQEKDQAAYKSRCPPHGVGPQPQQR